MKITAVETVRLGEHANILFVRLHTDAGLVGLGDTWRMTETVNTFVHKVVAPLLLRNFVTSRRASISDRCFSIDWNAICGGRSSV